MLNVNAPENKVNAAKIALTYFPPPNTVGDAIMLVETASSVQMVAASINVQNKRPQIALVLVSI